VLALDADFVVSAGLHEKLSSSEASAALLEDVSIQRNVVVLPAFETETSLGLEKGGDIANLAQRCEYSTANTHPPNLILINTIYAANHDTRHPPCYSEIRFARAHTTYVGAWQDAIQLIGLYTLEQLLSSVYHRPFHSREKCNYAV